MDIDIFLIANIKSNQVKLTILLSSKDLELEEAAGFPCVQEHLLKSLYQVHE